MLKMPKAVLMEYRCGYVRDYPVLILGLTPAGGEEVSELVGALESYPNFAVLFKDVVVNGARAVSERGWVDGLEGLFGHLFRQELLDFHHDEIRY